MTRVPVVDAKGTHRDIGLAIGRGESVMPKCLAELQRLAAGSGVGFGPIPLEA